MDEEKEVVVVDETKKLKLEIAKLKNELKMAKNDLKAAKSDISLLEKNASKHEKQAAGLVHELADVILERDALAKTLDVSSIPDDTVVYMDGEEVEVTHIQTAKWVDELVKKRFVDEDATVLILKRHGA